MKNSSFKVGDKNKLSKNEYIKEHYIFKGWSTTLNGEVKYKDEEEIKDLTLEKDKIIDLYAVWEINKYTVNVVVKDGIVDGDASKIIDYNNNATFNISPTNDKYGLGSVECTNNQKGTFENNILTVSNVTSDTTCTVTYMTELTTLYTDGTLIINEEANSRSNNITKHGEVTNEYEPMSASNSYVFTYDNNAVNSPWFTEREQVKSVEIGETIKPISTAYWFGVLQNMEKGNFAKLDTSNVIDMSGMFSYAGLNATTFNLTGLDNWDTSKVTNMSYMFGVYVAFRAETISISNLSNWNTSNVTDMGCMFCTTYIGSSVEGISNWNTSKVTNMDSMFDDGTVPEGISNWDTSSVTNMSDMFHQARLPENIDLSSWDTSKVTDMGSMFDNAGFDATTFTLDLSSWDTSQVTNMNFMFNNAGFGDTTFNLTGLDNWDTSKVTNMSYMFADAGQNATTFNLNLSKWNTSKVTEMGSMFNGAGSNATSWTVKIPSTTGSLTNTTSKWYGSSESVYANPLSGKSFTLP